MKPYLSILFAFLVSCTGERPLVHDEKIVVEGFIEEGAVPVVWLSKSLYVPFDALERGVEAIRKIPIRGAKVTVMHEGREEILPGRLDADHILGWCYRGLGELKGKRGGRYTLRVEYSGYTLTATTTIPAPARLGGITAEKESDRDGGLYRINTSLEGTSAEGCYILMAMTRSGEEESGGVYKPCLFGAVEGASLDTEAAVTVFRPVSLQTEGEKYSYVPTFRPGEHVMLRLASIDRGAFDFWSSFMNDVINAHNPVYPSSSDLPSNIAGGGLGIWYGFSADYGEIDLTTLQ